MKSECHICAKEGVNDSISKESIKVKCVLCNLMGFDEKQKSYASSRLRPCIVNHDYNVGWNDSRDFKLFPKELIPMIKFPPICRYCSLVTCMCCNKAIKYSDGWMVDRIEPRDIHNCWTSYRFKCVSCKNVEYCASCGEYKNVECFGKCNKCRGRVCSSCSRQCGRLDHGRLCCVDDVSHHGTTLSCWSEIHQCNDCGSELHHGKEGMKPCVSEKCYVVPEKDDESSASESDGNEGDE